MKNPFTHLHVHSEFSLWDGVSKIDQLTKKTAEMGMKHLAITDHGTMGGVIKFYESCKKNNIKPIIGIEGYFCDDMKKQNKDSKYYHLLVFAKNNAGYQNLMKLVGKSNLEGRYRKPRFDFECLANHSEGLIISSACILGEIPQLLLKDPEGEKKSINVIKKFKDIFGEDYYLEVMYQGTPGNVQASSDDTRKIMEDQKTVINSICMLSKKTNTKMIVTNDVHYVCQEDYVARYTKMKIGSWTGGDLKEGDFVCSGVDDTLDYHLKSPEEMWRLWGEHFSESLTNTYEIGEQCDLNIPLLSLGDSIPSRIPHFEIPEDDDGFKNYLSSDKSNLQLSVKYVKYLCLKKLHSKNLINNKEYVNRLKYELGVIGSNPEFCRYFLITRDFVQYSKDSGIYVGPGRGSASGSLVMHLLGVTLPDPIEHKLDFGRFLSSDKVYSTIRSDYC